MWLISVIGEIEKCHGEEGLSWLLVRDDGTADGCKVILTAIKVAGRNRIVTPAMTLKAALSLAVETATTLESWAI